MVAVSSPRLSPLAGVAAFCAFVAACPVNVKDIDPFGRPCRSADDCAGTDACVDLGNGPVCVPDPGEPADAGEPVDAGNIVDAGDPVDAGNGATPCSTSLDCDEGDGCVQGANGFFCAPPDDSGLRVQFGTFDGVPRLSGRSATGLVLRNGGLTSKPWVTGRSASGLTVIGGDLR